MKTELDDFRWLLEGLVYNNQNLFCILNELKISNKAEDVYVAGVNLGKAKRLNVDNKSQKILVKFDSILSFFIIDDTYCNSKEEEIFEGKVLRKYTKSNFKRYIKKDFSLLFNLHPDLLHYELITENEVISVIAQNAPEIIEIKNMNVDELKQYFLQD